MEPQAEGPSLPVQLPMSSAVGAAIKATSMTEVPFSMSEAASRLNFSQRQLERLFQAEFQRTPYGYFLQQKLLLAKQYLRNTRLPVKEISQRLGFCDPYYFSNCFKRQEGVCPRDYRRR